MEVKPISPADALANKINVIPPEMIQVVNDFLTKRFNGGNTVTIKQDELLEAFMKVSTIPRQTIFDQHMLDFEPIYRKEGWTVYYDKPGYSETYGARYEFSVER